MPSLKTSNSKPPAFNLSYDGGTDSVPSLCQSMPPQPVVAQFSRSGIFGLVLEGRGAVGAKA